MARGKQRLQLLLSLATAMADMVDMAATAMVTDMAAMDTMASMARGRLRQLLLLLLGQKLLLSLATDTMADTAMLATEVMAMAVMVTTALMARGLLMLTPTTATEDTEDMAMDTAMDMVMAMDMDTMDKKEGVAMMSRKSSVDTT